MGLFVKKNQPFLQEFQYLLRSNKELIHPDYELRELEYTIFDTETTGFHPYSGDQLIAIGAVKIKAGKITDTFHTYINPLRPVPPEIQTLTQITDQQLENQPLLLEGLYEFLQFAYQSYLVAHNADFDLHFLNIALKKNLGLKIKHPIIDTMNLAYHLHPRLSSHDLDRLLQYYQIPIKNRHNALGDAKMTAELLHCLFKGLEERGITTVGALKRNMPSVCRQAPYLKY